MKKVFFILIFLQTVITIFGENDLQHIVYYGISETNQNNAINVLASTINSNILLSFNALPTYSLSNISMRNDKNEYCKNLEQIDTHFFIVSGEIIETTKANYEVSIEIINNLTSDVVIMTDSFDTPNNAFDCSDRISEKIISHFLLNNAQEKSIDNINNHENIENCKHYFKFSNNLLDSIDKKFIMNGSAKYCPDRHNISNSALLLTSKWDSMVTTPYKTIPYNLFTMSLWFKLDNSKITDFARLVDCMDWNAKKGYNIIINAKSNTVEFSYFNSYGHQVSIKASENLLREQWYNVTVTFENGTSCLYLNGKLQEKLCTNDIIKKNGSNGTIGNGLGNYYLSGSIDDLIIFDSVLNSYAVDRFYKEQI